MSKIMLRKRSDDKVYFVDAVEFEDEWVGKADGEANAWHWLKSIWEKIDIREHEIANIGNLTVTVTHYYGKPSKTWRTDINLIAYNNHIAFGTDSIRMVIAALERALIVAESYDQHAEPFAATRHETRGDY